MHIFLGLFALTGAAIAAGAAWIAGLSPIVAVLLFFAAGMAVPLIYVGVLAILSAPRATDTRKAGLPEEAEPAEPEKTIP